MIILCNKCNKETELDANIHTDSFRCRNCATKVRGPLHPVPVSTFMPMDENGKLKHMSKRISLRKRKKG